MALPVGERESVGFPAAQGRLGLCELCCENIKYGLRCNVYDVEHLAIQQPLPPGDW